jgi:hypothetical protein
LLFLFHRLKTQVKTFNMMLPSSLLVSLFLLSSTTFADDGQYHPNQYEGVTTTAAAVTQETVTAKAFGSATAVAPTAVISVTKATGTVKATGIVSQAPTGTAAAATGGWEDTVTWPVGCESWANPCPPGAHISGGAIAGTGYPSGYDNGFTSYLTETDSNGVVTGMPTKATVAAGVETTGAATTLKTSASASGNRTVNLSNPSSTQNGFSTDTSSAQQTNDAGRAVFVRNSVLMVVVAVLVAMLC